MNNITLIYFKIFFGVGKDLQVSKKTFIFFFNEKINKNGSEVLNSREDAIQKITGRLRSLIPSTEKGQKEKEDAKYSLISFKERFLRDSKSKSYRYIMGNPNLTPVNPLI
jgi:hypothetical protein